MDKKIIAIVIVVAVIALGSFYAGDIYGKSQAANVSSGVRNFVSNFGDGQSVAAGGQRGVRAGGGFLSGEIVSKDGQSLIIKMRDGSSKIVLYSPSTVGEKSVAGDANDFVIGKQATVAGVVNSDGSVTAQSIQIRASAINKTN